MNHAMTNQAKPELYPSNNLRTELGWSEVQNGLGKILKGYLVLFGGFCFVLGLVVLAVVKISEGPKAANVLDAMWFFYLAFGLGAVIFPIGYAMIAAGHWRCLMYASERFHTKWLMFTCMTCLLMSPAINTTSWITGLRKAPQIKQGADGLKNIEFTNLGMGMQIVSTAVGYASLIFFVLFLRAVARCFDDHNRVALANMYLTFLVLLMAGTLGITFLGNNLILKLPVLIGLGGAWLLVIPGYVFMILTTQTGIGEGLAGLRSHLERERSPQAAAAAPAPAHMVYPTI